MPAMPPPEWSPDPVLREVRELNRKIDRIAMQIAATPARSNPMNENDDRAFGTAIEDFKRDGEGYIGWMRLNDSDNPRAVLRETVHHLMKDDHPDPLDRLNLADRLRALLNRMEAENG